MMHNDLLFSVLAARINFGGLFYPPSEEMTQVVSL